ncbi:hypothetical protein LX32DRAFT_355472 [Colletotrichum zoysiae]|uniref:Uncharacterized protein n=1 Tax=Colletotrichum zoysiae TaxID=1216348 RepID=A0AAD9HK53_9PEZI|nr:hypothetical protein LX32DRAFT_355472 [Colletotrichum zoysiae]
MTNHMWKAHPSLTVKLLHASAMRYGQESVTGGPDLCTLVTYILSEHPLSILLLLHPSRLPLPTDTGTANDCPSLSSPSRHHWFTTAHPRIIAHWCPTVMAHCISGLIDLGTMYLPYSFLGLRSIDTFSGSTCSSVVQENIPILDAVLSVSSPHFGFKAQQCEVRFGVWARGNYVTASPNKPEYRDNISHLDQGGTQYRR